MNERARLLGFELATMTSTQADILIEAFKKLQPAEQAPGDNVPFYRRVRW
jgi:hypothetical protein